MNASVAIKTYATVGLESNVASADPHKLIQLLYQGALLSLHSAKSQIQKSETEAKGRSITHAMRIIDMGLKASLDKNVGGELALNLSNLYDYMCQRLLHANLHNDVAALDEVIRLLTDLKDAWEAIRPEVTSPAPANVSAGSTQLTYSRA